MTHAMNRVKLALRWQQWFDQTAREHDIPGAQLGYLWLDDEGTAHVQTLSTGVTSRATGVEVDHNTVFQYGSITKAWTATLLMMLAERGEVDFDAPLGDFLGDELDHVLAGVATIRDLLGHTSGLDGDVFLDTGDGDDAVERYVRALSRTEPVSNVGAFSYGNAGYVVAGRIVEKVLGNTWDEAIARMIVEPLGLQSVVTRPRDAIMHRAAVGHFTPEDGDDEPVSPVPTWLPPRSVGPSGLVMGSARDLLSFAALHLREGRTEDGRRLLDPDSVRHMQDPHIDLSVVSYQTRAWGLGWSAPAWSERAFGHSGATYGQRASVVGFPESRQAFAVLTNAEHGAAFADVVLKRLGEACELGSPQLPADLRIPGRDVLGTYSNGHEQIEVRPSADGFGLSLTRTGIDLATPMRREGKASILEATPHRYVVADGGQESEAALVELAGVRYWFTGNRLFRFVG